MSKSPSYDTGLPSDLKAEFMLIEISYSCKLLFPIEIGATFLQSYCLAREYKKEYKKPIEIFPSPPEITIKYMTKADIAKIHFDKSLGLDDD